LGKKEKTSYIAERKRRGGEDIFAVLSEGRPEKMKLGLTAPKNQDERAKGKEGNIREVSFQQRGRGKKSPVAPTTTTQRKLEGILPSEGGGGRARNSYPEEKGPNILMGRGCWAPWRGKSVPFIPGVGKKKKGNQAGVKNKPPEKKELRSHPQGGEKIKREATLRARRRHT